MEASVPRTSATRKRYLVVALLFVTVTIDYLDRSNLSIAAAGITSDFQLSPAQMGWISARGAGPMRSARYRVDGLPIVSRPKSSRLC